MSTIENIRFGRPDASDEDVISAAKAASAHDFITNLPSSYQTFVGERGVMLSGGQKQRLLIIRELIKKPKLIIFDEGLSSLENN